MDVTALLNSTPQGAGPVEGDGHRVKESRGKNPSDDDKRDGSDGYEGDEKSMELRQSPSRSESEAALSAAMMTAESLEEASSRRPSESKAANQRSRTPWDAGGYSLSQALDKTKSTPVLPGTGNSAAAGNEGQAYPTPFPAIVDVDNRGNRLEAENGSGGNGIGHGIGSSPNYVSTMHKLSDSRSSFSSTYTGSSSSANSASHSRISSLSTVSENQPLASLITEFSHLETYEASCCGASGVKPPCLPQSQIQPTSHHQFQFQQYSIRGRARADEQDARTEFPMPARYGHDAFHEDRASPGTSPRAPSRSQSPSDAVMIHRLARLPEAASARDAERLPHPRASSRARTRPPSSSYLQPGTLRHHKRAVSAPDFASVSPSSFDRRFPAFGPIPEPTPSPSQEDSDGDGDAMDRDDSFAQSEMEASFSTHSGGRLGPLSQPMPDTAPIRNGTGPMACRSPPYNSSNQLYGDPTAELAAEIEVNFSVSVCMYRGDCQTGSQLRKAISHIFGRNKLCTRMIPTGVWVHYCRKHYQRTRYRNGGEYPQRQIGLVQIQVKRVQAWSDSNARAGHGPVLISWSLSVRKREQLRIENKLSATGKKRSFPGDDAEDDDEEGYEDERTPEMSGTAVPDWVISRIGDGYSTEEILEVVERLKLDIDEGRLQQIPDIEILPNIAADRSSSSLSGSGGAIGSGPKKPYTKRRTSSARAGSGTTAGAPTVVGNHRRTQSVNTALRPDSMGGDLQRRPDTEYFTPYGPAFDNLRAPQEKRQRLGMEDMEYRSVTANTTANAGPGSEPHALSGTGGNMPARSGLGSRLQLAHRPAFGGIQESHAEHHAEHLGYSYVEDLHSAEPAGRYHRQLSQEQGERAESHSLGGLPSFPDYDRPCDDERQHFPQRHMDGRGSISGFSVSGPSPSRAPTDASSFHGVLPAPNPQRYGDASVVQQLERSSYLFETPLPHRGSIHQRSQSEAGNLHQAQSSQMMRSTSSSGPPATSSTEAYVEFSSSHGNNASTGYGNDGHFTTSSQGHSSGPYSLGNSSSFQPKGSNDFRGDFDQANWGMGEYGDKYGKYGHVQLPPLQSMQPPSQPYGRTATYYGGLSDRPTMQIGSAPVYQRSSPAAHHLRHSRHQSSPAVSHRHLPVTLEAGAPSASTAAATATEAFPGLSSKAEN